MTFHKLYLIDEKDLELLKSRKMPRIIDYETLYDRLMTEKSEEIKSAEENQTESEQKSQSARELRVKKLPTHNQIKKQTMERIKSLPTGLRERAKKLFRLILNSGKFNFRGNNIFFEKKKIGIDIYSNILQYINPTENLLTSNKDFKLALRRMSSLKKWDKLDF